jgi:hypothetical protein
VLHVARLVLGGKVTGGPAVGDAGLGCFGHPTSLRRCPAELALAPARRW